MQKEIKTSKNKIPKITEEEYLQYVTSLKEGEQSSKNGAAYMQSSQPTKTH